MRPRHSSFRSKFHAGANLPKIFSDAYTESDDTRLFRSPASAYRLFDAGLHHPDERADEKSGHYQRRQMKTSSFLAKVNNGRTNDPTPLLTAQDACAYLQCTRRYLERMVRSGRLRALKPSPRFVRYRQADLDHFLENGATIGA